MSLTAQNAHWAKPNQVVLRMVLVAILKRKFHFGCLLRMAWLNKRETYVFEELGGFRAWLWYVWQWMPDYITFQPENICDYCRENY